VLSEAPEKTPVESESTLQCHRGGWEHLEALGSAGEGNRGVWEVSGWLPD